MGETTYIEQGLDEEPLPPRRTLAMIAGLILVIVIAYWSSTLALWRYWLEEPSLGGHGPLVAAIALYLIYRTQARLGQVPTRWSPWALAPLMLCSIASVILWKAGIQALQLLLFPALILLAVHVAFGFSVTRILAVPIGYLYFAMPAWNLFSVPLQRITLEVVRAVAPLIGLPASVEGSRVLFPDGSQFEVTLACSGVVFLVQALAVATFLGELEGASLGRRWRLLVSIAAVALATNWLRVLALIALGYSSGMRNVLATRDHLQFGYVLFVVVIVGYVWIVTRRSPPAEIPVATPIDNAVRAIPSSGYVRAIVALIAVPIAAGLATVSHGGEHQISEGPAPVAPLRWAGSLERPDPAWQPKFVGAQIVRRLAYSDAANHGVELLEVGYPTQAQGRELVNEENSLLGSGGLTAMSEGAVSSAGMVYLETVATDAKGNRSIIWSYYQIGGYRFATPIFSQLWYGVLSLYSTPYSTLIALRVQCEKSCDEARASLAAFAREAAIQARMSS